MNVSTAPTFLQWWTSHDVDDRTLMLRRAHGDREAIFSLMRSAYAAGLAAASVAQPASSNERQLDDLLQRIEAELVDAIAHEHPRTSCFKVLEWIRGKWIWVNQSHAFTTKPVDVQKPIKVDDKRDAYCIANCTSRYHDSDCRHHP